MLPKTAWGVKLGHRRDVRCMTALPSKAEVPRRSCYVAQVPTTVIGTGSLDPLIGAGEHGRRNVDTQRLRGLEVDEDVEFRRQRHRQLSRLITLDDTADVAGRLPISVG